MDDPSTISVKKDTSYCLIREYIELGHQVYIAQKNAFSFHEGHLNCKGMSVQPFQYADPILLGEVKLLNQADIDIVWIRCDPPFDADYLNHMWLFEHFKNDILFLNHPTGIRTVNEKLWATQWTSLTPPTVVTKDAQTFESSLHEYGEVVIKPTDGFGGSGIFKLKAHDSNTMVAFEQLSNRFQSYVIIQKAIPNNGDKRILLLNGDPIGAVLRRSDGNDHRHNFMAGGNAFKAEVTDKDQSIIDTLKPDLLRLGLFFVGIDIIGDHLIEVNVTSPTCLQEMNRLNNQKLESRIIESSIQAMVSKS